MKFRNIVILFIIAALVFAWYTKPTQDEFKKFLSSEKIDSPPVIEVVDGLVFTKYTVSYFEVVDVPKAKNSAEKKPIAVPMSKAKYLGLFGKFWKMD